MRMSSAFPCNDTSPSPPRAFRKGQVAAGGKATEEKLLCRLRKKNRLLAQGLAKELQAHPNFLMLDVQQVCVGATYVTPVLITVR